MNTPSVPRRMIFIDELAGIFELPEKEILPALRSLCFGDSPDCPGAKWAVGIMLRNADRIKNHRRQQVAENVRRYRERLKTETVNDDAPAFDSTDNNELPSYIPPKLDTTQDDNTTRFLTFFREDRRCKPSIIRGLMQNMPDKGWKIAIAAAEKYAVRMKNEIEDAKNKGREPPALMGARTFVESNIKIWHQESMKNCKDKTATT